jgi:hypothetical protein
VGDERLEEIPVRRTVPTESRCGVLERAPCEDGRSVFQRMSDCGGRLDQFELELQ